MINQTSEYALRAVVCLAIRPNNTPISAQDIAGSIRVPVGYLQKILRMLARRGLLKVTRGTGGGFALAKVPTAISVLDVLEATNVRFQRIERCPLGIEGHTRLCSLHRLLDSELERTMRTFADTTIDDLLDGEGGIRPLCDATGRLPITIDGSRPGEGDGPGNDSEQSSTELESD